ncbi:hypothetical protein PAXRUDRAFT_19703 [Paxillus rubicundulus Ve08.2h10]|uniref:Uncharacterized protein n=1 Tax=Paxillus rubicundulus Ve08.2h10 TaxID=930991 RepID=A0A0D0D3T1_9AGAM|nr:hypothetical protein PAXRUDRAFT_19703 [Paxillus rubicundulus Ve08.2h10]
MAPSKETSCEGSLPTAPPTPVRLLARICDLSVNEGTYLSPIDESADELDRKTTPPAPTLVAQESLQKCISKVIEKLSVTQLAGLIADKPLSSSLMMPSAIVDTVDTLTISPGILVIKLKTKNETLLMGALWEAEECCQSYKQCIITLQAQAVLNEAYCNKLHFQLAFQEEKKSNPGTSGKLVIDGLPRLLSGDKFYERVVEFTRYIAEGSHGKERDQKACTGEAEGG